MADDPRRSLRLGNDLGLLAMDDLLRLAQAAKDLGVREALLTSGQRLLLPGLDADQEAALRREFSSLVVHGHDLVQACPGKGRCRLAKGDTLAMARRVAELLRSLDLPAKAKAGVSGCANCCAESRVRDLGFIAGARGWTVVFGGNAGKRPRTGDELGRELSDQEALDLARAALEDYARLARPGERTARFQERRKPAATTLRPGP